MVHLLSRRFIFRLVRFASWYGARILFFFLSINIRIQYLRMLNNWIINIKWQNGDFSQKIDWEQVWCQFYFFYLHSISTFRFWIWTFVLGNICFVWVPPAPNIFFWSTLCAQFPAMTGAHVFFYNLSCLMESCARPHYSWQTSVFIARNRELHVSFLCAHQSWN